MAPPDKLRWQYTSAICPKCRSLTFADRHCDELPLELAIASHTDALTDRIWGPPVEPDRSAAVAVGGLLGAGAVVGFFVMLAVLAAREPGPGEIAYVGIAGLSLIAVGLAGVALRADGKRRSGLPERNTSGAPVGGRPPIRNVAPLPVSGTVADGPQLASPLSGRECLAYSAVLARGSAKMLRAASTIGFVIETTDGQRVHVPPGEIALTSDAGDPVDAEAVDGYLVSGLPVIEGLAGEPLFPYDRATERIVVPGDRVRMHSHLEPVGPGKAKSYRESAAPDATVVGIPVIELLDEVS